MISKIIGGGILGLFLLIALFTLRSILTAKMKDNTRIYWASVVIFLFPIGAILYSIFYQEEEPIL